MGKEILITIITPVYNGEKTIGRTIESVINQTYKNIQYIIVDGKSTDKTLDVIKNKVKDNDINIKIISEQDQGIYDAMNKGINNSNGEIIGIINADDWYELNAVQKIIEAYKRDYNKLKVFYSDLKIYKNEEFLKIWQVKNVDLRKRMLPHPTIFVSKNIYEKYGKFKIKYKINADWDFLLRLNTKKEIEFKKIDISLANFRTGGASSYYSIERLLDVFKIYTENLNILSACYYFFFYGIKSYVLSKILNLKKRGRF